MLQSMVPIAVFVSLSLYLFMFRRNCGICLNRGLIVAVAIMLK